MYYRYEGGDSQLQDQLQHEISPSSTKSDITISKNHINSDEAHYLQDDLLNCHNSLKPPPTNE